MLDDFKTELKRLGIKRMRQDELRRQSFALVVDPHESKDDDGHMEFSDALNVNPARFQTMQNLDNSANRSPMGRLRQDSVNDSHSPSEEYVGKSGKKISRLPGLKDFSFTPGRKKAKTQGEAKKGDEELAPPPAPDRLSQMRQSLGVIDYHPR